MYLKTNAIMVAGLLVGSFALHGSAQAENKLVIQQLKKSSKQYRTAVDWAARKAEIRTGFLKGAQLWPLPQLSTPNVISHSKRVHNDYTVENLAIESFPGFYCTGNLYRPVNLSRPGPIILCPHGHFAPLGRYRKNQQIRCAHFARMGATVFSYSLVGWQDSTQTTHQHPLALALQTINSIRALDYLSQLPGVDPQRVGITGASGGGTQTIYLSLVDERVKVAAPLVIVYPWTEELGCNCEGGLPVMSDTNTNMIEIAASLAPLPQMLISVGNDPTSNFPNFGFPYIRNVYQIRGAVSHAQNLHLEHEKHDFGLTKRNAIYQFFAEHLNFKLVPEETEKIVIETPDQMSVFNKKHPLPPKAIKGDAEITRAFELLTQ